MAFTRAKGVVLGAAAVVTGIAVRRVRLLSRRDVPHRVSAVPLERRSPTGQRDPRDDASRDGAVRRFVIVSTTSGGGKTTLARALARRLDPPFVEMDALAHGPDWSVSSVGELRALVEPMLAGDAWVIDGAYRGKIGDVVLEKADTVV